MRILSLSTGHRSGLAVALTLFMVTMGASNAQALDYNDVKNLVANHVSEQVIVNMLQQSNPVAATGDQVNELRSMGASENLIANLQATASAPTATAAAPAAESWTYVDSDGTVYSSNQAPGSVVAQPSGTVVAPGVVQTSPSTTTYVDPNVTYYDSTGGVIVTSPPTVVYETPTYVEVPTYSYPYYSPYRSGPSWSFSFGFGGGGRRHYGRPHGRPYGPPRGRPGRPGRRPGRP